MPVQFTMPPDTRVIGIGAPSADMNGVVDALNAEGAQYNVLNAANAGGADPTGVADSTAAIQAALNATAAGQPTILPVGTFLISSPITMFSGDELLGSHGSKHVLTGTVLKLSASFAGAAAIILAPNSSEQRITRLNIDASSVTVNTVIGIMADTSTGPVQYVQLSDILITAQGISTGISAVATGTNLPNGWRCERVVVLNTGGTGIILDNAVDGHWTNCQAIGSGGQVASPGWSVHNCANSLFTACRADFAHADGWLVTGAWTNAQGSGGCQWIGCSTDRNAHNGVSVVATGPVPLFFDGLMCRRDGSASTSAGYAALNLAGATCPVVVDGVTIWPGPDDNGTGNVTPQYGISVTGSSGYLQVASGYVQGVSASVNNDGTNTYVGVSPDVIKASGPNTAVVFDGQPTSTAIVSEVDVANTVTETTLVSLTLPTGSLRAGTTYRINLMGTIQVQSTSGSLVFKPYLGANASTAQPTMSTVTTGAGPSAFWLVIYLTVRTTGASGTFVGHGFGEMELTSRVNLQNSTLTTAVVDTTAASPVIKVTATWATASATNVLKVHLATIDQVGKVLT
jgi:hypothetical protein